MALKVAFHHANPIEQAELVPSELKRQLSCEFPQLNAVARHRFVMVFELAQLVFSSRKSSTIRFTKGAVEYPSAKELPLFVVSDHRANASPECVGAVHIAAIQYKTFAELDERDALNDGFESKEKLVEALQNFYGEILADDVLSVFEFSLPRRSETSRGELTADSSETSI